MMAFEMDVKLLLLPQMIMNRETHGGISLSTHFALLNGDHIPTIMEN